MSDEIKSAMARAFFASAWADQCEETGNISHLSGVDIMDVMPPEPDPAAVAAAERLAAGMERVNGAPLDSIFERAAALAEERGEGDRKHTAENFGHYAAMQAMGHGVGLCDAFGSAVRESVRVPYLEFSAFDLERDYFAGNSDDESEG